MLFHALKLYSRLFIVASVSLSCVQASAMERGIYIISDIPAVKRPVERSPKLNEVIKQESIKSLQGIEEHIEAFHGLYKQPLEGKEMAYLPWMLSGLGVMAVSGIMAFLMQNPTHKAIAEYGGVALGGVVAVGGLIAMAAVHSKECEERTTALDEKLKSIYQSSKALYENITDFRLQDSLQNLKKYAKEARSLYNSLPSDLQVQKPTHAALKEEQKSPVKVKTSYHVNRNGRMGGTVSRTKEVDNVKFRNKARKTYKKFESRLEDIGSVSKRLIHILQDTYKI